MYDSQKDRLFVTYEYDPGKLFTYDMMSFYAFQFPDLEKNAYGKETPPTPDNSVMNWSLPFRNFTTLVSNDKGITWHLATTDDFK
jgi:hypothetical protein